MLANQPSQTQLRTAIRRATHQLLDDHIIFDDPVALRVVPEAADPQVIAGLQNDKAPDLTLLRTLFAMRSRFAEDRLAAAVARGARQYVVLGAGLDTFPWRQPQAAQALRLFMVDHPESLVWSQHRFHDAGLSPPENTAYVPADLERDNLRHVLTRHGLDPNAITCISMLGVSQYLSGATLDHVLRFAAALVRDSELVVSIALPDDQLSGADLNAARRSAQFTGSIGEPWLTRMSPHALQTRLSGLGFRNVFHLTPEIAQARYLQPDAKAPGWEQVLAAIV
jgi:methyltransferase (TIGR00027 family)